MTIPLLQTKFHVPQARPDDFISRSRLIQQLDAGRHRKLTLISAAAGSGKTTIAADWLRHLGVASIGHVDDQSSFTPTQTAWLSLDGGDNDFPCFLSYLVAAFQTIDAGLGQTVSEMLLQTPQSLVTEVVLTHLINDISSIDKQIVLALDDFHVITETIIHEALQFWLDNAPPNGHLVITTRVDPPISLALLRGRRQMTELRAADLRFTLEETAQFLNQVTHLSLSSDQVSALEARTEGWAAGLQMAALAMQGQTDVSGFIQHFTGSHRYIFDYLADQVLDHCLPETRQFLLHTSILNRMCALLCDAVMGAGDPASTSPESAVILASLEEANLFIVPLDQERRWYRYHHLFSDLLRTRLHQTDPDLETKLHLRASHWYENATLDREAIEHALWAHDYERAARLIEPIAHGMAYRMETEALERWVRVLPEDLLVQYPDIVFPYAVVLSVTGRFDEYDRYLEKSEQAALANIDKSETQVILGQVGVHKSIRRHLFGNYEQALQQVTNTQSTLHHYGLPDERWELISIAGYGILHTKGQVETALAYLDQATRMGTSDEGSVGALLCNTFTANAYLYMGQLQRAEACLQTALQAVTLPDGTKLSHAVFPSALLARLAYERNELDKAAQYVDAYLPLTDIIGFTTDPVDTLFVATMLPLAQGHPEAAIAVLDETEQLFQTLPISDAFTLRLTAIKARLWLHLGYLQSAVQWADSMVVPAENVQLEPRLAFPWLVWARIRLTQKEYAATDSFLTRLRTWAAQEKLNGIVLEATIVQALSSYAQNDASAALEHLNTALTMAAPEGYIRIFVDQGDSMLQLLHQGAKKGIVSNDVRTLLAAFETKAQPEGITSLPLSCFLSETHFSSPLIEPLTTRELELLSFLAEGLTNQEIANQLIIAVSTVKRHCNNIYGKLGVRNRTEAVNKARELNLV